VRLRHIGTAVAGLVLLAGFGGLPAARAVVGCDASADLAGGSGLPAAEMHLECDAGNVATTTDVEVDAGEPRLSVLHITAGAVDAPGQPEEGGFSVGAGVSSELCFAGGNGPVSSVACPVIQSLDE